MNPEIDSEDGEDSGDDDGAVSVWNLTASSAQRGERLDKALAQLLPRISRSRLRQWIDEGAVLLNAAPAKPRALVIEGDRIEVRPLPAPDAGAYAPEPMALNVVHEDESILVIDKPAGLVVHPGAGNWSGTLLNGLLAYDAGLAGVPRAGIVHRLDADTSGLMVVARTLEAQIDLVRQLQARTVLREYWAIVYGEAPLMRTIDAPIARHPRQPTRFGVSRAASAREARTRIRRIAIASPSNERVLSWVACRLQTGRTHQIRVHMESIGHPLLGDPVYRRGAPSLTRGFARQALHACRLALTHPRSAVRMQWFRPPPEDMAELMRALGFTALDEPLEVFE